MTERTCRNCKHFLPYEGKKSGRCANRKYKYKYTRKIFITWRGCKACAANFEPIVTKPLTNYDRIKAMSIEEMAVFFAQTKIITALDNCYVKVYKDEDVNKNIEWLESEAEK